MIKYYISIDGGTTNTRIMLIKYNEISEVVKLSTGARNGIDNKNKLKDSVRAVIADMSAKHGLDKTNTAILASGMITCEFGLYEVPHITAPSGVSELHSNMKTIVLDDITDIPFNFIPGVKTVSDKLDEADIMRGEETEVMGIAENDGIYILPGSHSKIIELKNGKIISFCTMLTGEMIAALSQNTILKDAVSLIISEYDEKSLSEGYEYCDKNGINEALFKVRILKNIFKKTETELYSFFLGIVLHSEIKKIINTKCENVYIGGKHQIKKATASLLKMYSDKNIAELSDEAVEKSTYTGMLKVYNYR